MRFRTLLGSHLAADPPEATLVLAALAGFSGLRVDGMPMPNAEPWLPSMCEVAEELGLHVGAVRRGIAVLGVSLDLDLEVGLRVPSRVLSERWRARTAVIRLDAEVRQLGLRARPLLAVGVVAGRMGRRGQLTLPLERLSDLTGLPRRTLQRSVATAEQAGALHGWRRPGVWVSMFALGPHRKAAQGESREAAQGEHREEAHRREAAQGEERREQAHPPSQRGAYRTGPEGQSPEARTPDGVRPVSARRPPEPAAEPESEEVPWVRLQAELLRTGVWGDLRPLDRLIQTRPLADALVRHGMTPPDCRRLWQLAQGGTKPTGLFVSWLAADWRAVLAASNEGAKPDMGLA